jgi:multidrug resistance efflux pump
MRFETQELDKPQGSFQDDVRDGLDELDQYLRTASAKAQQCLALEAGQVLLDIEDDPAQVGLDRLERTVQAARLNANRADC